MQTRAITLKQGGVAERPSLASTCRMQVDGKYFARGGKRFRIQGVTYGPFAEDAYGHQFPETDRVRSDFALMREGEINTIRTYHVPPDRLLQEADEAGLGILVDIPWRKHLCFLDSLAAQGEARQAVRNAAVAGRMHPCILAYSIANEIPANIVRWHGAARVQRFLAELADVARQANPNCLVTYANYPSTEYLELPFLDFATFNVYLHDPEVFRSYLVRLHNLVGDQPVLLGELGMDTIRHGESEQALHLLSQVRDAMMLGTAGSIVFSWTDDWHTGGHDITDWAFGITSRERDPKPAYYAIRDVFQRSPAEHLVDPPRVSVVVCSYNGASTLDQCLRSLTALDYPDYEVIVVDDGSTDNTGAILAQHPRIKAIQQPNLGLSAARNAGLQASTGTIIAYTDSDCFADPDWLTQLVYQLRSSGASAVGGPNLTPEDGWLAACVAASPGQPTHVLVSDQMAEHIPGCNMAFRREALVAINGFDPVYRKAGDDVDVCWRLQQAGHWITFAPGAFVWHHRRQNPRAFLKQQGGYGEAEALLRFKHPDRFNSLGDGKWQGALYGAALQGLRLGGSIIYHGVFGTGLFQCVYRAAPAHWAMLPSTLEWHAAAMVFGVSGFAWPLAWLIAAVMLVLSVVIAVIQAAQAKIQVRHRGVFSRIVVAGLCYAQPLVRSWKRYRTRLFSYCPPSQPEDMPQTRGRGLSIFGKRVVEYWSEDGRERTELLSLLIAHLNEHRWGKVIDSGWSDWDITIDCYPWSVLQLCTAQEDHGERRRLLRLRYQVRSGGLMRLVAGLGGVALVSSMAFQFWPAAVGALAAGVVCAAGWWRGLRRASIAVAVMDSIARRELRLIPLGAEPTTIESSASIQNNPPPPRPIGNAAEELETTIAAG